MAAPIKNKLSSQNFVKMLKNTYRYSRKNLDTGILRNYLRSSIIFSPSRVVEKSDIPSENSPKRLFSLPSEVLPTSCTQNALRSLVNDSARTPPLVDSSPVNKQGAQGVSLPGRNTFCDNDIANKVAPNGSAASAMQCACSGTTRLVGGCLGAPAFPVIVTQNKWEGVLGQSQIRQFHVSSVRSRSDDRVPRPDDPDYEPPWKEAPAAFRLSTWPVIIWPSVLKTLKNWFLAFLIKGYMDESYSTKDFLDGAEQAVILVSETISEGNFENIRGLVEDQAIGEVQVHYADLNVAQRGMIKVNPGDLFFRYIYEVGMIFDDMTGKRFVEITTVFQGCPGIAEARKVDASAVQKLIMDSPEKLYICNYRFIREFTKGVEDEWLINKLNHFHPKEIADHSPPFSR